MVHSTGYPLFSQVVGSVPGSLSSSNQVISFVRWLEQSPAFDLLGEDLFHHRQSCKGTNWSVCFYTATSWSHRNLFCHGSPGSPCCDLGTKLYAIALYALCLSTEDFNKFHSKPGWYWCYLVSWQFWDCWTLILVAPFDNFNGCI